MNFNQETETKTETKPEMSFNPHMSLYIPSINRSWDQHTIADIFAKQHIGHIDRIDFRKKRRGRKNGRKNVQAFIYFTEWHDNEITRNLQARINNPEKQARIVYMDPYFWELRENNITKQTATTIEIAELNSYIEYLQTSLDRNQTVMQHYVNNIELLTAKNKAMERMYTAQLERDEYNSQRKAVVYDDISDTEDVNKEEEDISVSITCDNCRNPCRPKYCGKCREAKFCSKECQREAWRGGCHTKSICQEIHGNDDGSFLPVPNIISNEDDDDARSEIDDEISNNFYHRYNYEAWQNLESNFERAGFW